MIKQKDFDIDTFLVPIALLLAALLIAGIVAVFTRSDRRSRSEVELSSVLHKHLTEAHQATSKSLSDINVQLKNLNTFEQITENLSNQIKTISEVFASSNLFGQLGEQQLLDILEHALPSEMYASQKRLSNGKIVDVLLNIPSPPGPIPVDSKFPFGRYRALARTETSTVEYKRALGRFKSAVNREIEKIAGDYIIPGETSDFALMFVPSDVISIEIQKHPELIDRSHENRVYIVSPSTFMATVTTMRGILRSLRQHENINQIQIELAQLLKEVETLLKSTKQFDDRLNKAISDSIAMQKSAKSISEKIQSIVRG